MTAIDDFLVHKVHGTSCGISNDTPCTCGRDEAAAELAALRAELDAKTKAVEALNDLASEMADAISAGNHNDSIVTMQNYYAWLTAHPPQRGGQDPKEQE